MVSGSLKPIPLERRGVSWKNVPELFSFDSGRAHVVSRFNSVAEEAKFIFEHTLPDNFNYRFSFYKDKNEITKGTDLCALWETHRAITRAIQPAQPEIPSDEKMLWTFLNVQ